MPKLIEQEIEFYPDTNIPIKGRKRMFIKKILFFNDATEPYYHLISISVIGLMFSSIAFYTTFKLLELFHLDLYLSVWSLLLIVPVITLFIVASLYLFSGSNPARRLPPYISIPIAVIIISQAHFLYRPLQSQHYYDIVKKNQQFDVVCEILDEYVTQTESNPPTFQYHYTLNLNNKTNSSFDNVYATFAIARGTTKVELGEYGIFEVSTDFPPVTQYPISSLPPGLLSKSGMLSLSQNDVKSAYRDLDEIYRMGKDKVNRTVYPVLHVRAGEDIEKDLPCTTTIDWYNKLRDFYPPLKDSI